MKKITTLLMAVLGVTSVWAGPYDKTVTITGKGYINKYKKILQDETIKFDKAFTPLDLAMGKANEDADFAYLVQKSEEYLTMTVCMYKGGDLTINLKYDEFCKWEDPQYLNHFPEVNLKSPLDLTETKETESQKEVRFEANQEGFCFLRVNALMNKEQKEYLSKLGENKKISENALRYIPQTILLAVVVKEPVEKVVSKEQASTIVTEEEDGKQYDMSGYKPKEMKYNNEFGIYE